MHISLFGGSFNPPHLGHQIVINQAFELIPKLEKIWLLPDYQHAFAKNSDLAPVKHRLTMTKMLETSQVRTQTCKLDQKMPGYTLTAVHYLQTKYPQHQFSCLIGSDQLKVFTQWHQYQKLLKLIPFYVYPRAGFPLKPLFPNMTALTHPLQIITNISSTTIRQRLQAKLAIKHLIPAPVLKYINQHHLYQPA